MKKLGEVCDIICGQDYKSVKDDNGKYPIYGTGGIMGYASQYRCPANSVIIGRKGSINNPLFVETEFWNVDTAFGVVPNEKILHPKFFYLFCKDYDFTRHDVSVTIPSLRRTDILKINVPVPPIAEQEKIVDELDCLSGIIEKKKQQLKELDNLAQSIFYEMFGDPVENDKGWEIKRLGDISQSQIGITYKPENVSDDNGTIVLRSGNIQESALCFNDIVRVNCDIKEHKYVQKGDILMCSRNGSHRLVGKVAMIPELSEKMTYGAFMTIIRSDFQSYLFAFFKTPAFRLQLTSAQTATINQITVKMLNEIIVALPPLSLQQDFASKIESIEKQKELIAQSIKETETLFNSRMDYYFN